MDDGRFIGQPVPRVEDQRLLTGRACFVDDIHLTGTLEMVVYRSPMAHAKLIWLDLSRVRLAPGVVDAFGAGDLEFELPEIPIRLAPLSGFENFLQRPLAQHKVRYVGEPIAVVVAENRYLAEDALSLIEAEWQPLPALSHAEDALRDDTLLFDENGSNCAGAWEVSRGDTEAAFCNPEYYRKEVFKTQRQSPFPLEARGLVAEFDPDSPSLRVYGATKVNYFNRAWLSRVLKIPVDAAELLEVDVGGGFGSRGELYPEDYLVPLASLRTGRPVKWIEDRREHFLASNHARDISCIMEVAADRDGTIRGFRAAISGDVGAYIRTNGGVALSRSAQFLHGPYRVPAYSCSLKAVMTNKTPAGTYRGPGRFEANFFRERMMDIVASDLRIDVVEFRMRNLLTPSELPFCLGELVPGEGPVSLDAADYPAALLEALGLITKRSEGRPEVSSQLEGTGFACFVESSAGGPPERARVSVAGDGSVEVRIGASSMGQGLKTSASQICAGILGIEMDEILVLHGTTSLLLSGGGTFHSRNTVMAGNAVASATRKLRKRCLELAALRWNTHSSHLEFSKGGVDYPDTGARLTLGELAELAPDRLSIETTFDNNGKTAFSYGVHAVRVGVDPHTGGVKILNYVVVEDVGRVLNPLLARGQALGGAVQGIGGALFDKLLFDADGQPLTTNLGEYLMPTSLETGEVEVVMTERYPSVHNPMGFKGAGEGGIVAAGGAVGNAIAQALSDYGVNPCETPIDPVSLLQALEGERYDH